MPEVGDQDVPSTGRPSLGKIPNRAFLKYTSRFSEKSCRTWRRKADPLADAVVEELAKNNDLTNIHDLLGLVQEQAALRRGVFKEFVDAAHTVPEWADFQQMERGQQILLTYDPIVRIAFAFGSLMGVGGQFPKMGDVVRATGMLDALDYAASKERLERTGQFIVNIATVGALCPGGAGHNGILRIRLLHSAVRRYLSVGGKCQEAEEVPLNQHDLAITLALFGYIGVRSLHRLGVRLSQTDVASYMLLWRYTGYVLGIDDALLPHNFEEQKEFFLASTLMMGDYYKAAGPEMQQSFLHTAEVVSAKTWGVVPKQILNSLALHLMVHLAGREYLEGFDLALPRWAEWSSDAFLLCIQAWGSLLSLTDRCLPFGVGAAFLYKIHLSIINLMQPRSIQHKLRAKL